MGPNMSDHVGGYRLRLETVPRRVLETLQRKV